MVAADAIVSAALPVVADWFKITPAEEGVLRITEPHTADLIRSNSWLILGQAGSVLIDTGNGIASLQGALRNQLREPLTVIATHAHSDHIGGMHEFSRRLVHGLDAEVMASGSDPPILHASDLSQADQMSLRVAGYEIPQIFIDAVPNREFNFGNCKTLPAPPERLVEEGDLIELGDRSLRILHLPGHTPGSIGVWDEGEGVLYSGDVVYDGPLLDELPESDIANYVITMRRLLDLPVKIVHPGHNDSFDWRRLRSICKHYIERRGAP